MTGSGKTGLCIGLLEEALIDGIPAILIDPKGDLANLCLTFPDLRPEDFPPWVNEDDARRKGLDVAAYAAQQAELWRKGLAAWGQDGARIRRLRDAADVVIYTPGSTAGLPVSIVKSFAAPPAAVREDAEIFRERIGTTATSLLGLLGIEADPLQSREHILLARLLETAWREGRDLDLPGLIQQIQTPPVTKVGALDLDAFFPPKDRFALAMRLNNLLAAPGFDAWLEGEPLDVGALLHTAEGKPRVAIFSIAHLSDAERMFFVSLLLNETLGWMRAQSGTTSLRAIVYMDEIFGYFPPVANPPSKLPLLTLLKQARAFGVGVVLATQNPVDLDYKGLANTGTWFIGRLQTERDKARVLDGLEGVAAGSDQRFDRAAMEELLGGLGNRVFLLNNVHEDGPEVFETRWAMSYLRGPLTRTQIKQLMADRRPRRPRAGPRSRPSRFHLGECPASGRDAGARRRRPRRPRRPAGRRPARAPARRPPALRARARARAGGGRAGLPADGAGRGHDPVRGREGRRGADRGGRGRGAHHGRRGPGELGGGPADRRPRRRPRDDARRTRPSGRRSRRPPPGPRATRAGAATSARGSTGSAGWSSSATPRHGWSPGRARPSATSACASARKPGRRGTSAWKRSGRSTPRRSPRSRSGSGAPSRPRPGSRSRSRSRVSRRRSRWEPRSSAPCSAGRR